VFDDEDNFAFALIDAALVVAAIAVWGAVLFE
jgi:hypothetical protein